LKWGKFYQKYKGGIFQKLKKDWYDYRVAQQQSIWYLMNQLDKLNTQLNNKIKRYIRKCFDYQLFITLSKDRDTVQNLLSALQAGTGNLMQQYFDQIDFYAILHALPAWIVNATEVHQYLPLEKELFDVVIIDEATQCDIASSLPLLQRGAKAIIVGDPKQLRHISFLSQNQQALFAERHQIKNLTKEKLDYRNNSVLDLASLSIGSQDQIHFLDEHYRSMPDIIQFSNEQFYGSQLKVMTATPQNVEEQYVFKHKIAGKRNAKGFNEEEADALIEMLKGIIEKEKDLHKKLCQSIGVVSPFRAQVNHLKSKIRKAVDLRDVKRHELLIGTPYHFQGEERDVMLISFAVDNDTHPSTFLYLNKTDVFNVSISRARSLQHLFVSFDWKALNRNYLIAQYLQQVTEPISSQPISTYEEHDGFLEEVVKVLKKWGVNQIYKSYPVAGMIVDIVVIHNEITYCIDLVGFPGEYGNIFPIDRWRQLKRVGVKTFSLPYSSWYIDQSKSKKALKKFLTPK